MGGTFIVCPKPVIPTMVPTDGIPSGLVSAMWEWETEPDYLMTMHGLFWRFPKMFTATSSAGIRPRTAYLKVIGDFARWNDELVFGCDDSAQKEFLNKRKAKWRYRRSRTV